MNKFKALFLTSFAMTVLTAAPAMAHSVLKNSSPTADTTVEAPRSLELTFSETVNLRFSSIELTGPDGAAVRLGKPVNSQDGHTLLAPLPEPLSSGRYDVKWDALSQDGHKINGNFSFLVK